MEGVKAAQPATGNVIGDLYVSTDNNIIYRWDGSAWVVTITGVNTTSVNLATASTSAINNTLQITYYTLLCDDSASLIGVIVPDTPVNQVWCIVCLTGNHGVRIQPQTGMIVGGANYVLTKAYESVIIQKVTGNTIIQSTFKP